MFRRCTVATWCAAWRNPSGSSAVFTISVSVVPAPSVAPLPFKPSTRFKDTRILGAIWRRFMLGSRSVPPAMSIASGPSPARMRAASAMERGARYSNHGSRIILLDLLAVAAFPGRRHVERGQALVLEERRDLVHQRARELGRQPAKDLLFHQRFGKAHVHAALDLPARQHRVDGAADVVRDPDLRHGDPAGLRLDFGLDHAGGVRIRGRRTHARALVASWRARRLVRADGPERAELLLGEADRLGKAQAPAFKKYFPIGKRESLRCHFKLFCGRGR